MKTKKCGRDGCNIIVLAQWNLCNKHATEAYGPHPYEDYDYREADPFLAPVLAAVEKDLAKPMRTDQKKVMMQLNSPIADAGTAAIFTKSATGKYKPHDWRKGGLPWTARVASLKRHIALFEAGIDIDRCLPECPPSCIQHTNLPHVDCIGANAVMLQEFFRTTRGDDDRYTLSEEAQIELQRIIEGTQATEVRQDTQGTIRDPKVAAKKA